MLALLDDIIEGEGTSEKMELLEELANVVKIGSLCALGKTAPNPVLSTFRYFREELEAHVFDKRCPAGECEALLDYYIIPEKCVCCSLCAKQCPVDCITGKPGKNGVPYVIDVENCIKCGVCKDVCKFDAVIIGKGE
jgi:formate hydrogenlyase subunit 6/NADH:ubiquinone oxidoreductase subunit I